MSDKSYSHKKRIVYTALHPFFSGKKLMQAMVLWDKKFSNSPSTAVQHFVYELKNSVDANADIRGTHLNLIRVASLPESELLGDPTEEIKAYISEKGLSSKAEFSLPTVDVLLEFLLLWKSKLNWDKNRSIETYIRENISTQQIDTNLAIEFLGWFSGENSSIRIPNAENRDLRRIINLFYVACCEFSGPIATDETMNDVVNTFKNKNDGLYSLLIKNLL